MNYRVDWTIPANVWGRDTDITVSCESRTLTDGMVVDPRMIREAVNRLEDDVMETQSPEGIGAYLLSQIPEATRVLIMEPALRVSGVPSCTCQVYRD